MAGAAARIAQKSRAFGSAASCCASKLVDVLVVATSTTGDWPLTVDAFGQRRDFQLDVHRRGEAEADADPLADHGREAGELVGDLVFAGWHRREAVGAFLVGHRRPRRPASTGWRSSR